MPNSQDIIIIIYKLLEEHKIHALVSGWIFFAVHTWGQIEIILGIRKKRLHSDECSPDILQEVKKADDSESSDKV